MDDVPLILIFTPAPGAPVACWIFTPGSLDANAWSKLVTAKLPTNFDPSNLAIEPVILALDCVPYPITTTSSNASESS